VASKSHLNLIKIKNQFYFKMGAQSCIEAGTIGSLQLNSENIKHKID